MKAKNALVNKQKVPKYVGPKKPKQLKATELLDIARKHILEITNPYKQYPYHYSTTAPFKQGEPPVIAVLKTDELHGHVLTADKLGYDTQLLANHGTLRVVFVKRPGPFPPELNLTKEPSW